MINLRRTIFCVTSLLLIFSFSCKSVPDDVEEGVSVETTPPIEQQAVQLSVPTSPPKIEKLGNFPDIKPSTLKLIENGTLLSLKEAASLLRSPDQVYNNQQIILLNVISGIMSIVYPGEKLSWPIPPVDFENNYTAALNSAKKGVYDFSVGTSDFLELALPSLVLITAPSLKNYYLESEASLKDALKLYPESFLANYLLALLFYRQNRDVESMQYFEKAYAIDDSCITMNQIYANCLIRNNKNALADKISKKILQNNPDNIEILKVSAISSFNSGNLQSAEQYVIRVLQQEPDNMEFILLRAKILMKKGEYLNVSSLLDVYSRNNGTDKDYLLLRAELQRDWNKNISAASSTIQTALNLYPDDIDVLLMAASIMASSGQKIGQKSLRDVLDTVLKKDPNNAFAQELLISEYLNLEDWNSAYNLSFSLINKKNYSTQILLQHIKSCIALKLSSEARNTFILLKNYSVEKNILDLVEVQILIAEGRKAEALNLIQKALSEYSGKIKSNFYYEKSRIASNDDQKLSDLRSSLTANPRNPEALFALYEYYFKKADYRKAQYYLRQVVALNPESKKLAELNAKLDTLIN